jgi:hypothetical protein
MNKRRRSPRSARPPQEGRGSHSVSPTEEILSRRHIWGVLGREELERLTEVDRQAAIEENERRLHEAVEAVERTLRAPHHVEEHGSGRTRMLTFTRFDENPTSVLRVTVRDLETAGPVRVERVATEDPGKLSGNRVGLDLEREQARSEEPDRAPASRSDSLSQSSELRPSDRSPSGRSESDPDLESTQEVRSQPFRLDKRLRPSPRSSLEAERTLQRVPGHQGGERAEPFAARTSGPRRTSGSQEPARQLSASDPNRNELRDRESSHPERGAAETEEAVPPLLAPEVSTPQWWRRSEEGVVRPNDPQAFLPTQVFASVPLAHELHGLVPHSTVDSPITAGPELQSELRGFHDLGLEGHQEPLLDPLTPVSSRPEAPQEVEARSVAGDAEPAEPGSSAPGSGGEIEPSEERGPRSEASAHPLNSGNPTTLTTSTVRELAREERLASGHDEGDAVSTTRQSRLSSATDDPVHQILRDGGSDDELLDRPLTSQPNLLGADPLGDLTGLRRSPRSGELLRPGEARSSSSGQARSETSHTQELVGQQHQGSPSPAGSMSQAPEGVQGLGQTGGLRENPTRDDERLLDQVPEEEEAHNPSGASSSNSRSSSSSRSSVSDPGSAHSEWPFEIPTEELQDNLLRDVLRTQLPRWNIPPHQANTFADWIARNWRSIRPSSHGFSRTSHSTATLQAIARIEQEIGERYDFYGRMMRLGFRFSDGEEVLREIFELLDILRRLEESR